MPRRKPPNKLLRHFIEKREISIRDAAEQLCVKHPTVHDWMKGSRVPERLQREAIETWTSGYIPASLWESEEEKERREALERVRPFQPTGT